MGGIVTEGDVAFLKSSYPEMDITLPTGQQEQLILYYFRGYSIPKAAQAAGYRSTESARKYLATDSARAILELLKDREFDDIRIDRDTLTSMFMEAYHEAATSTEKIAATRELGKLYGIYPDQKKAALEVNVGQMNIGEANVRQLQQLTDAELAAAIGPEMLALVQAEDVIDVEPEDIEE